MAKKSNANTIAAKKRDNRLPHYMPPCSIKGCDEVFFIYTHHDKKRVCRHHYENPPQESVKTLLTKLGLI